MNEKGIITENKKAQKIINKKNKINTNNTEPSNLNKNSGGKKEKYNSYDDFNILNNKKQNFVEHKKNVCNSFINNCQLKDRNFAIIRNINDIIKYMPIEKFNGINNNYYSLLNDFEVKYPKGNTNFYLIYNEPKNYNEYNRPYLVKSQESFKLRFEKHMNHINIKKYSHNISKISLPFCIYSQKPCFIEKRDTDFNNHNKFNHPYSNNDFGNNKKVEKNEESKNNDNILIMEYNGYYQNINNLDYGNKNINNIFSGNNVKKESNNSYNNNHNINNKSIEEKIGLNVQTNAGLLDKNNNNSIQENKKKDDEDEGEEEEGEKENDNEEKNEEEEEKDESKQQEKYEEKKEENIDEEKEDEDEQNTSKEKESFNEGDIESNNNDEKISDLSEEKKNETDFSDTLSMKESDDELFNRKKLTTNSIINIIRLPKHKTKNKTQILRLYNNKYGNKKVINSKESKYKKDDEPDNTNKKNYKIIKEKERNTNRKGKMKVKSVEFLREIVYS